MTTWADAFETAVMFAFLGFVVWVRSRDGG
jgi:hypothetical protein